MEISPRVSVSISWIVDIEVLGLGSRILCPGSSFQTMSEKSGKERKSLCLIIPKLSISSSYFFLKCHSLYILCFDTLRNNLILILVFVDETREGLFLSIGISRVAYLKVYGSYPEELFHVFQGFQTQYGRGIADICMHNERVNKLIKFFSFVQQYQFISVCHYQLILSFVFEISKLRCDDSFRSYQFIFGKNIGWYHLLYFIVTLSSLIYYFVKIKFHKNERYPKQFFNLIIEQHQFLLNCFIRFKRLELLKDLGIGVGIGVL